jgi:hypothetical protein
LDATGAESEHIGFGAALLSVTFVSRNCVLAKEYLTLDGVERILGAVNGVNS